MRSESEQDCNPHRIHFVVALSGADAAVFRANLDSSQALSFLSTAFSQSIVNPVCGCDTAERLPNVRASAHLAPMLFECLADLLY